MEVARPVPRRPSPRLFRVGWLVLGLFLGFTPPARAVLPVTEMPGKGTEISVGADGSVWMVGTDSFDKNRPIYRWTGAEWNQVNGRAWRIAVDPQGHPWKLNKDGEVQSWDGSAWINRPGRGTDLAFGANGDLWMVGWYDGVLDTDTTPQNRDLFRWNGSSWDRIDRIAVRVAVAPDGTAWVVDGSGTVRRRTGSQWVDMKARAQDIAISPNGSVWITGNGGWTSNGSLDQWTGNQWVSEGVSGRSLSVGPDGLPWFTQSDGDIYRAGGAGLVRLPGRGTDFGVGADGSVWMVGWDNGDQNRDIFRWTGTEWSKVEGRGKRISVDPLGRPWKLNKDGEVQRWNGTQFVSLPGKGSDIAVGANGDVWMVGWYNNSIFNPDTDLAPRDRSIFRWNGTDWSEVAGGGVRIAVAPDGTPWIVDDGGRVKKRVGSDWVEQGARAQDIAIGADGSVYITGHAGWTSDGRVDRWDGTTWVDQDLEGRAIAVGPDGQPWFAQFDGALYRRIGPAPAAALETPVMADGRVQIRFTSTSGRTCQVRVRRSFNGPWEILARLLGTGSTQSVLDTPPAGSDVSYYSVLTE